MRVFKDGIMKNIIQYIPGLLICLVIALAAKYLTLFLPAFGAVTLAIILGIIIGNLMRLPKSFSSGIKYSEKTILSYAIMLMGLKLQLSVLKDLGLMPILLVISIQIVTFITAILVGKALGFNRKFSLLMGAGNAVCGSSAIAATAPVLEAKESEVGISIGVVNLMGTIGIFLLPALVKAFSMSQTQGGYFTGGILQAVGQVVAAGFSIGEEAGTVATLIKMLRVLMLGPIVLILSLSLKKGNGSNNQKVSIPPFIIGFFIFSIIATIFPHEASVIPFLKQFSKILLMIAMAAIGMKIKFADLLKQGPKALLLGVIIFVVQIGFTLVWLNILS